MKGDDIKAQIVVIEELPSKVNMYVRNPPIGPQRGPIAQVKDVFHKIPCSDAQGRGTSCPCRLHGSHLYFCGLCHRADQAD